MPSSSRALLLLLAAPLSCAPFAYPEEAGAAERTDGAWEWCPLPTPASEVEDGALWLQFSEEALYCTREQPTYNVDTQTIWDELSHKAQVRLVPSDNFLPFEEGTHDVVMPVCARLAGGESAGLPDRGTLVVETTEQLGREHVKSFYRQPLAATERELDFRLVLSGYRDELASGLVLSGEPWSARSPNVEMFLCGDESCEAETTRRVVSCAPEGERRERWEVAFQGGNLRFSLLTGPNGYDVTRAEQAEVIIDGASFFADDFFDLAARPTWPWSSGRDLAVKLPRTTQGHCGVVVRELYSGGGGSSRPLELIRCDGGSDERQIVSRNLEVEDLAEPEEAAEP